MTRAIHLSAIAVFVLAPLASVTGWQWMLWALLAVVVVLGTIALLIIGEAAAMMAALEAEGV